MTAPAASAAMADPCATLRHVTDDRPSPRPRDVVARAGDTSRALVFRPELGALTGGSLSDFRLADRSRGRLPVGPPALFVLPGERTDGHRFLGDAVRAGAAALLVTRPVEATELAAFGDVSVVRVPDALRGLGAIAAGWRARFDLLVVGVTGSIAKTSTKEAVATVLAADRRTLRSEGNQNNEVGLPLTLLRLGPEDKAAVLEMGMYVGGEIRDLAGIARPRIGVVTAVLGVHLSRIGTIDAVEDAKAELVEALPAGGVAVLNADDPRVRRMASRTPARVETYGSRPMRGSVPRASSRPGSSGCASRCACRPRPRAAPFDACRHASRRLAGSRSTTRWPGPPSGSRRG
jgi:hypothetical protein